MECIWKLLGLPTAGCLHNRVSINVNTVEHESRRTSAMEDANFRASADVTQFLMNCSGSRLGCPGG